MTECVILLYNMAEQHTAHVIVRATPRLKRVCERAAARAGLSFADWVRATLAMAANQGAFGPPQKKGGQKSGSKRKR